jgi:hypothetical protein
VNYQTLNYDEKTRLIRIILDLVDELKEFDDFQETISLLCEDIPGLECLCQSLFDVITFSFCSANRAYCCLGATETFVFHNNKLFCTILDSIHQQEKQEGKDEQPKFR